MKYSSKDFIDFLFCPYLTEYKNRVYFYNESREKTLLLKKILYQFLHKLSNSKINEEFTSYLLNNTIDIFTNEEIKKISIALNKMLYEINFSNFNNWKTIEVGFFEDLIIFNDILIIKSETIEEWHFFLFDFPFDNLFEEFFSSMGIKENTELIVHNFYLNELEYKKYVFTLKNNPKNGILSKIYNNFKINNKNITPKIKKCLKCYYRDICSIKTIEKNYMEFLSKAILSIDIKETKTDIAKAIFKRILEYFKFVEYGQIILFDSRNIPHIIETFGMTKNNISLKYNYNKITIKENNIFLPLRIRTKSLGMIILKIKNLSLSSIDLDIISVLLKYFSSLLYNVNIYNIAVTDELTRLYNRKFLSIYLHEIEKKKGAKYFIIFDIDHFKHYNDSYGHKVGDHLLSRLSIAVKNFIEPLKGSVFRYGGEEFLIILDDYNAHIFKIANKIRALIENMDFSTKNYNLKLTISMGISKYPDDSKNIGEIINLADKALYYSKRSGRNRVSLYDRIIKYNLNFKNTKK